MAGLDPAIHRAKRIFEREMDARVKPAHDDSLSHRSWKMP
jgi:hypothetical protein